MEEKNKKFCSICTTEMNEQYHKSSLSMFERMIDEIKSCLDNDCPISALSIALIIPDMCGKAEYPNEKNRQRYVKWFNEWIGKYETYEGNEMPYLSGDLVYSLRCSMLHEGNPTIENGKFNIDNFSLIWSKSKDSYMVGGLSFAKVLINNEGQRKLQDVFYEVNIMNLIFKICRCSYVYFKENKSKFDFLNYKIVEKDF